MSGKLLISSVHVRWPRADLRCLCLQRGGQVSRRSHTGHLISVNMRCGQTRGYSRRRCASEMKIEVKRRVWRKVGGVRDGGGAGE